MPDDSSLPPTTVFILFHEKSEEGQWMADFLFRWLRLHRETGLRGDGTSVGLPVYYRSQLKKKKDGSWSVDPPLEPEKEARHTVVVVMADDHLTTDERWQSALRILADEIPQTGKDNPDHVILPVMLARSLDALHFFSNRDPLRVFDPKDPFPPPDWEDHFLRRGRRLRRGLTEAMIRLLHGSVDERLRVFISHAKADGVEVAMRLRDGLASVSKLQPWFDATDLPWGKNASDPMSLAAAQSTGGMIVVLSDAYPNRPWCRREAALARTPRLIETKLRPAGKGRKPTGSVERLYEVQPTVIARVAGSDWTRIPPSITQAPMFGWPSRSSIPSPSEAEAVAEPSFAAIVGGLERKVERSHASLEKAALGEVVDRLLLELLLAKILQLRVLNPPRPIESGVHPIYLNFLPDAWTLQQIRDLEKPGSRRLEFVYPGHGFLSMEREEIHETARSLFPPTRARRSPPKLIPLDALDEFDFDASELPESLLVGLSAGGKEEDVRQAGIGMTHVDDLMVRITQRLLQEGHRVAYGGALTNMKANLTKAVLEAASAFVAGNSFAEVDGAENVPHGQNQRLDRPPVVNYAAWPYTKFITTEIRGRQLGLCGFELVEPLAFGEKRKDDPSFPAAAEVEASEAFWTSEALTRMRAKMAEDCEARILFAGTTFGWAGGLPGIAEELLEAFRGKATRRILLIGGFGGCADHLVEFLIDKKAPWPSEFGWEAQWNWWKANRDKEKQDRWLAGMDEEKRKTELLKLRDDFESLRDEIHAKPNGILRPKEIEEFRKLAKSSSTRLISKIASVLREA